MSNSVEWFGVPTKHAEIIYMQPDIYLTTASALLAFDKKLFYDSCMHKPESANLGLDFWLAQIAGGEL